MGRERQYQRELAAVLLVYAVVLVATRALLGLVPDSIWRFPLALAPMVPAMFVPWVVLRRLQGLDELQRQIQLEALGFAFAGTAVITFGYGFLETVGFPHLHGFAVWPLMAVLWIVGRFLANRRYR